MGPTQVSGFGQLAVTCMNIPSSSLIDAISDVTRCAASSCHDGKKNGDEVSKDCGGSCGICKVTSAVVEWPVLNRGCKITSLAYLVSIVNAACALLPLRHKG